MSRGTLALPERAPAQMRGCRHRRVGVSKLIGDVRQRPRRWRPVGYDPDADVDTSESSSMERSESKSRRPKSLT